MHFTFTKTFMELAKRSAALGDQQASTGIPIEAMHQLDTVSIAPRRTQ
jgi:hypothetical protein